MGVSPAAGAEAAEAEAAEAEAAGAEAAEAEAMRSSDPTCRSGIIRNESGR